MKLNELNFSRFKPSWLTQKLKYKCYSTKASHNIILYNQLSKNKFIYYIEDFLRKILPTTAKTILYQKLFTYPNLSQFKWELKAS